MTIKNLNPIKLLSALIGCLNRLVRSSSVWLCKFEPRGEIHRKEIECLLWVIIALIAIAFAGNLTITI